MPASSPASLDLTDFFETRVHLASGTGRVARRIWPLGLRYRDPQRSRQALGTEHLHLSRNLTNDDT